MAKPTEFLKKMLEPSTRVGVTINGAAFYAQSGETVLSLLVRNGYKHFRRDEAAGNGHGYYCAMGVCFECLVMIDGIANRRACITQVCNGMDICTENHNLCGVETVE